MRMLQVTRTGHSGVTPATIPHASSPPSPLRLTCVSARRPGVCPGCGRAVAAGEEGEPKR
jgi:hypothetical protein